MSIDIGAYGDADDDGRSRERPAAVSLASVQIMLVRMEAKFDTLSRDVHYMREAQLTRATENERRFNDYEARMRILEANRVDPMRIHVLESKRYLEAKSITTVAAVILPVVAIGVSIIAIVIK